MSPVSTQSLIEVAESGPLERVEELLGRGALPWEPGVLEAAKRGRGPDREAIVALLARPVIVDPELRDAVAAIHAGDLEAIERMAPELLHRRIVEPEEYGDSYFHDPMLLWFVAGNPSLRPLPDNIALVTRALLSLGPAQGDRDYALELVMTSALAREQGHQIPLMNELLEAGATATSKAVAMALAHQELEAVRELIRRGHPMTAPIAAGLGELSAPPRQEAQLMLALAVINDQVESARLALEAGADVNGHLPIHEHSTALHQAALTDDPELLALLISYGARRDARDTVWNGTPLDWAIHEERQRAREFLEE
ncbi:MAG TPA: ankyrin repeat domain-containing protein [Solirubrobacteraceae bacterium]|nr:ankyrin repeat domain-containing protein [Solirubrobacteraceae bacterium]